MRRFIYLDTDTLNSYIAQIYDGLIQSTERENQKSTTNEKQTQNNVSAEGSMDFKLFGKGLEGKMDYAFKRYF